MAVLGRHLCYRTLLNFSSYLLLKGINIIKLLKPALVIRYAFINNAKQ